MDRQKRRWLPTAPRSRSRSRSQRYRPRSRSRSSRRSRSRPRQSRKRSRSASPTRNNDYREWKTHRSSTKFPVRAVKRSPERLTKSVQPAAQPKADDSPSKKKKKKKKKRKKSDSDPEELISKILDTLKKHEEEGLTPPNTSEASSLLRNVMPVESYFKPALHLDNPKRNKFIKCRICFSYYEEKREEANKHIRLHSDRTFKVKVPSDFWYFDIEEVIAHFARMQFSKENLGEKLAELKIVEYPGKLVGFSCSACSTTSLNVATNKDFKEHLKNSCNVKKSEMENYRISWCRGCHTRFQTERDLNAHIETSAVTRCFPSQKIVDRIFKEANSTEIQPPPLLSPFAVKKEPVTSTAIARGESPAQMLDELNHKAQLHSLLNLQLNSNLQARNLDPSMGLQFNLPNLKQSSLQSNVHVPFGDNIQTRSLLESNYNLPDSFANPGQRSPDCGVTSSSSEVLFGRPLPGSREHAGRSGWPSACGSPSGAVSPPRYNVALNCSPPQPRDNFDAYKDLQAAVPVLPPPSFDKEFLQNILRTVGVGTVLPSSLYLQPPPPICRVADVKIPPLTPTSPPSVQIILQADDLDDEDGIEVIKEVIDAEACGRSQCYWNGIHAAHCVRFEISKRCGTRSCDTDGLHQNYGFKENKFAKAAGINKTHLCEKLTFYTNFKDGCNPKKPTFMDHKVTQIPTTRVKSEEHSNVFDPRLEPGRKYPRTARIFPETFTTFHNKNKKFLVASWNNSKIGDRIAKKLHLSNLVA